LRERVGRGPQNRYGDDETERLHESQVDDSRSELRNFRDARSILARSP
jgi:hypothetical protein